MMGKIFFAVSYLEDLYFRKFSLEQADLDDADEDGNTIYRGLAIPVDIRQVVEVGKSKITYFNSYLSFIAIRWL